MTDLTAANDAFPSVGPPVVASVGALPEADVHAGSIAARWSDAKRLAFKELKPAALVLVATDGPVSVTLFDPGGSTPVRRLGHNRRQTNAMGGEERLQRHILVQRARTEVRGAVNC